MRARTTRAGGNTHRATVPLLVGHGVGGLTGGAGTGSARRRMCAAIALIPISAMRRWLSSIRFCRVSSKSLIIAVAISSAAVVCARARCGVVLAPIAIRWRALFFRHQQVIFLGCLLQNGWGASLSKTSSGEGRILSGGAYAWVWVSNI